MAKKSSQPYSSPEELRIGPGALNTRWARLTEDIRSELRLARGELLLATNETGESVTAAFAGGACELVERQRGKPSWVAPICALGTGPVFFWLGFHEKWEKKHPRAYIFHHVSLTVHVGRKNELSKPQIFRSEWPGIRSWTSDEIGFQSPGAGHPHWQFDAMSAVRGEESDGTQKVLERLRDEQTVVDFDPDQIVRNSILDARNVALDRVHFASSAPWWLKKGSQAYEIHMNAPSDAEAISRWTLACIAYVRQELQRC